LGGTEITALWGGTEITALWGGTEMLSIFDPSFILCG